jgi:hypothetical protein
MPPDPVQQALAEALRALVAFVAGRPEDASADDDVRALEDAAYVLQQVEQGDRDRLTELLGPVVAEQLGLR